MVRITKLVLLLCSIALALGSNQDYSFSQRLPLSVQLEEKTQEGKIVPSAKIVGGTGVIPNSFPFQVSLQRRKRTDTTYDHVCGGSVLNSTIVLTAAQCVVGTSFNRLRVVAGAHDISDEKEATQQVVNVKSVAVHPDYDSDTYLNDIALIVLSSELTLAKTVAAIRLPEKVQANLLSGTEVTVTGWGDAVKPPVILYKADLTIVSDVDCNSTYADPKYPNFIYASMVCARSLVGNQDACRGDSGGPLFTGTGVDAVQHGIISWGKGCAKNPGVYTQISYFLDWIKSTARLN